MKTNVSYELSVISILKTFKDFSETMDFHVTIQFLCADESDNAVKNI